MEKSIRNAFNIKQRQLETYSPLTFAYIGDCFYELVLRTVLVTSAESSAKSHTKQGTELAKAVTQAKMMDALLGDGSPSENEGNIEPETEKSSSSGFLTEEEIAMFKRGRNANTTHGAKNASASEYRRATGFEALIGWLYLSGNEARAIEIIRYAWEKM